MNKYTHLKKVLIAEDDLELAQLLKELIEDHGLHCETAVNGKIAFSMLQKSEFDLLITDFRMPEVDGVELLDLCRKNGIHIPVIFSSSDADLVKREQVALGDCCATLMFKPVNQEILTAALGAADMRSHHMDCVHNRLKPFR